MNVENCDLTAKIFANSSEIQISLAEPDGSVKQKTVSVDDLVLQLAKTHTISTDILPRGTRFYKGSSTDYYIGVELEPKRRPMIISHYNEGKRTLLPVPRCLFVLRVKNYDIYNNWLFCLDSPFDKWSNQLYSFPYGNVYREGNICWGNAQILDINKPMDALAVFASFFDSGFNGDLINEDAFVHLSLGDDRDPIDNLWDLVKYVVDTDEFPEELMEKKDFSLTKVIEGSMEE